MATEAIVFPSATGLIINYLTSLVTVPVSNRTQNATKFAKVLRTGGTMSNLIFDRPQITTECYDQYEDVAELFALEVRAYIHAMEGRFIDGVQVGEVFSVGGPQSMWDPQKPGSSRFTFTSTIELSYENILTI